MPTSALQPYPPDTDTTTATAAPTGSSSSSPPPLSHQSVFTQGGASPPLIVGFISIGAFVLGVVSLCAWRRLTGRHIWYYNNGFMPRRYRTPSLRGQRQQDGSAGGCKSEKPVVFEAWTARGTADVLKWAESVPFSATLFTDAPEVECMVKDPTPRIGDDGVEEEEEKDEDEKENEKQGHGAREGMGGRLQVAVLLQMPSPNRAEKVGEESLGYPVRGELAIGVMDVPWAEDHHSLKRTPSL